MTPSLPLPPRLKRLTEEILYWERQQTHIPLQRPLEKLIRCSRIYERISVNPVQNCAGGLVQCDHRGRAFFWVRMQQVASSDFLAAFHAVQSGHEKAIRRFLNRLEYQQNNYIELALGAKEFAARLDITFKRVHVPHYPLCSAWIFSLASATPEPDDFYRLGGLHIELCRMFKLSVLKEGIRIPHEDSGHH